ncbi:hypothetical protein [Nocardia fluminea]|uniref:hypothetical protein n=1 Tax=Nocardia fluminea TaxID=134984 RepID=UPI003423F976
MSDNYGPSVEDEIVRDTSRTLGQVMAVARKWIQTHRGRRGADGVAKLSRKERRDLAESIRVQVGEQKIAAAWYTKRVNDYRAEVIAAQIRRDQLRYTRGDVENDQARLAGIRYSIESTLHETQSLPLERRGQVAMALSAADRNPDQRYGAIFRPMDREQERVARSVAVLSETWVAERREDNARLVAEQRAQAAKRAEERRQARPPRDYEELTRSQRYAVQSMRAAHLGVDRSGKQIPADRVAAEQEQSKAVARFQGLTEKEIGEEIAYMAENTCYVAEYGDDHHVVRSYYPYHKQALTETRQEMANNPQLSKTNVFAGVRTRPDGLEASDPEARRTFAAERADAIATVARWEDEPFELLEHVGTPHEVAVARIEPGTGRVLHSEVATLRNEQRALDFAHRGVTSADPGVARMRVEVTDPARPEMPRYHDYGLPRMLADSLSDLRVASRERLLHDAERDHDGLSEGYVSLEQRHWLSIEHNAELTDQNGKLTRQLAALTAERDQAVADRDKFRGERDQAVQKVAAMTPAKERLGSPERQAAQARTKAAEPDRAQKDLDDLMATARGAGALNSALQTIGVSAETRGRVTAAAFRLEEPARPAREARTTSAPEKSVSTERPATADPASAPVNAFSNASTSVNAFAVETERDEFER